MIKNIQKTLILTFLIFVVASVLVTSGCLSPSTGYGTVIYDEVVYPIENTNTVTFKTLDDNTFYAFFKNSVDKTDGYYFVNGKGQIFENLEHNYDTYPIELTPVDLEIGAFNWGLWLESMGKM